MRTLSVAAILGLSALGLPAMATGARADVLSGSWSGSGFVQPKDGQREKVRCRVSYSPEGSKTVSVSATCASASMTIRQSGSLTMVSPNRYVGDFFNSEYNISGRVRVSVSGGAQTVTFSSDRGGGSLNLSRR